MDDFEIIINGVKLTPGQALTVHVALQSFASHLSEDLKAGKDPLGSDEHGRFMTQAYLDNIAAINAIHIK